MPVSRVNLSAQVNNLAKNLMNVLTAEASRELFFRTLSKLLQGHFHFDRLCINIYDQQGEMLTYFTAAEGTVVHTLSPVRPADISSTVAGHVIAGRKPVIITDFAQYFSESNVHPIAEVGLTATMAFPLLMDNEIIATLHCSFVKPPENFYEIMNFLLELCPAVAICVSAIFTLEHLRRREFAPQMQGDFVPSSGETIICHSKAMREVMRKVDTAAELNIPVLLLGETGTGKSLLAQSIHRRSPRKGARFVRVNCPSLPATLFESELFGHAKGAFTGAAQKRVGRFELAHGGTLFLDEIGELTPEMQSKLLQVLEDSSFERVGESIPLLVDARMIAATNLDISTALADGKLRGDFFYRLALHTIELPSLRERREDIPPLVAVLAAQSATKLDRPLVKFTPAMIAPLLEQDWPGNVRELRNVITRVVIRSALEKESGVALVERVLEENKRVAACGYRESASPGSFLAVPERSKMLKSTFADTGRPQYLARMEQEHILRALKYTDGVIAGPNGAAALLGIPRSTLQHRMRKLGISGKSISAERTFFEHSEEVR